MHLCWRNTRSAPNTEQWNKEFRHREFFFLKRSTVITKDILTECVWVNFFQTVCCYYYTRCTCIPSVTEKLRLNPWELTHRTTTINISKPMCIPCVLPSKEKRGLRLSLDFILVRKKKHVNGIFNEKSKPSPILVAFSYWIWERDRRKKKTQRPISYWNLSISLDVES